jgi:DNA-binding GntR family transcriptional regulator
VPHVTEPGLPAAERPAAGRRRRADLRSLMPAQPARPPPDVAGGAAQRVAGRSPSGLADRVYTQVRARILLGQARPGDVIAAHALADDLSVSRTPVHEALKRLVGEGYLVALPRVGYAVTSVNLDEMRDLFQVRVRLEALSAELAARAWTQEHARDFAAADRLAQRRHRELRSGGPPFELAQFLHDEHKRFHLMIADVGGNRRLRQLISELQDETQRFWSLLPTERLVSTVFLADQAHAAILDAIATGDPAQARAAVVGHLREGMRSMLETVVPDEPPPDDLNS